MIPHAIVLANLDQELRAAMRWGERKAGLHLEWSPATLELRATLSQPETREIFFLKGTFDNYPAVAPKWEFCNQEFIGTSEKKCFPIASSLFHTKPVICAPFNRMAYHDHGGPHGDWGGTSAWKGAARGYVQAHSIGEMIAQIWLEFSKTRGRMS